MLTPHVGIVRAEKEVADAGGRCVALFGTLDEAEGVASGLRDIGCAASAGEVADWP